MAVALQFVRECSITDIEITVLQVMHHGKWCMSFSRLSIDSNLITASRTR